MNGHSGMASTVFASEQMAEWYDSPVGQRIAPDLLETLAELSRDAFGYHAVQLGAASGRLAVADVLRIRHCVRAHAGLPPVDCRVAFDMLPFETESVDQVVAWHVLEDRREPHELLREMDRVLRPEGKLVIVGINPASLMHLSRYIPFTRRCLQPVHAGIHHAPWRVVDWLRVLGYEINAVERLGGLLPLCGKRPSRRRSQVSDMTFSDITWFLHGFYMISATRRIMNPIQMKQPFRLRELIGAKPVGQRGVVEPSRLSRVPPDK